MNTERHTSHAIPSGIEDLDRITGGLLTGDNVVWVTDQQDLFDRAERLLIEAGPSDQRILHVSGRESTAAIRSRLGDRVQVLEAKRGSSKSDPIVLEQTIVTEARNGATRIIVDGLASFADQWGLDRAVAFFRRVCPRLFDLGAIAYWRVSRDKLGNNAIDSIRKVTQCVFELSPTQLKIVKAEGRSALMQGRVFRITLEDEMGIEPSPLGDAS